MNWQRDQPTANAAQNHPLPLKTVIPAGQFGGRNFSPARWNRRVLNAHHWPAIHPLLSSPQTIIQLFQQGHYLEALAMVVSWGTMWRHPAAIYGNRPLLVIEHSLQHCAQSILQTHSIHNAWQILTGAGQGQLAWSAVMTSKTLHFLSRSLGFQHDPPVALDNAVIRNNVWPAFVNHVPHGLHPADWSGNTFQAYSRYMTAILEWAHQRNWTTTQIETTIFDEYR